MRSNILKIMAIITIIIIIILIILIYMLNKSTSGGDMQISNNIGIQTNIDSSNLNIEPVKNRNIYYTVINCVNQYLTYIVNDENDSIYAILDSKYIKKNNIKKDNVLQYVDNLQVKTYFTAESILEEVVDDTNANYYVSRIYSRLFRRRYISK